MFDADILRKKVSFGELSLIYCFNARMDFISSLTVVTVCNSLSITKVMSVLLEKLFIIQHILQNEI